MNDYQTIEKVIRYVDARHEEQPSLAELARVAGLSESRFHRLFSRWAGVTPKAFLKAVTCAHAKELLRRSSVLDAALGAGLSGPGRLHDLLVTVEGVTPGEFKAAGAGLEIAYGFHDSPFGRCLIAATRRGICHLSFIDGKEGQAIEDLRSDWPRAKLASQPRAASLLASRVFGRRAHRVGAFLVGTSFQLKVWQALLRIPAGRICSYGALARAVGAPGASRAVGTAVGANPVAFLIPCHRVLRETGAFGGYRWGTERKRAILAWEARERSERATAPRGAEPFKLF